MTSSSGTVSGPATPVKTIWCRSGSSSASKEAANRAEAACAHHDRVLREVRIAEWLAEQDYPAVRTAADVKQAIEADGRLVTFWELVPQRREAPGDHRPPSAPAVGRDLG
ncbi:MAG: hypothetical protein ACRDQ1_14135 [Sciscionella sp.]